MELNHDQLKARLEAQQQENERLKELLGKYENICRGVSMVLRTLEGDMK